MMARPLKTLGPAAAGGSPSRSNAGGRESVRVQANEFNEESSLHQSPRLRGERFSQHILPQIRPMFRTNAGPAEGRNQPALRTARCADPPTSLAADHSD